MRIVQHRLQMHKMLPSRSLLLFFYPRIFESKMHFLSKLLDVQTCEGMDCTCNKGLDLATKYCAFDKEAIRKRALLSARSREAVELMEAMGDQVFEYLYPHLNEGRVGPVHILLVLMQKCVRLRIQWMRGSPLISQSSLS